MSIQFDPSNLPTMSRRVGSSIAVRRLLGIDLSRRTTFDDWTSTPVLLYALESIRERLLVEHHRMSRAKLTCHYWAGDFLRVRAYGWWYWFHYGIAWNNTVARWEAEQAEPDVPLDIKDWSDTARWMLSMLSVIARDEAKISLHGGPSGPKSVAIECWNVLVHGEPDLPEFKWETPAPTRAVPAWMHQGKTPDPSGPEYFTSGISRLSSGSLNVFMKPLPWAPMPDLGQVDIFGSNIPDAPNGWYSDEDSDYESDSGSEFGSESEFEYEVVVIGGTGEPSRTQGIRKVVEELTEGMEEIEDMGKTEEMEIGEEAEEMEQFLPHEIQLRQQEEVAVRNAIERRETLIRDDMDPNLASNFDYDYNSTDGEDDNADEHSLYNHLLHSREFSRFLSTLI